MKIVNESSIVYDFIKFETRLTSLSIDDIGRQIAKQFISQNEVQLSKLTDVKIIRCQEKTVNKFLQGIEDSKKVSFEKVLFALGIRHVGEVSAKKIARYFQNIDNLKSATKEQLIEVADVGEVMAESIVEFFSQNKNLELIDRLEKAGVNFVYNQDNNQIISQDLFKGKTIVVTGTLKNYKRDEIKDFIEQNGGKVSSSVSSNTSFVLTSADNEGSNKIKDALRLNIEIIDEEKFEKLVTDFKNNKDHEQ